MRLPSLPASLAAWIAGARWRARPAAVPLPEEHAGHPGAGRGTALAAAAATLALGCLALGDVQAGRAEGAEPANPTTVLVSAGESGGEGTGPYAAAPPALSRDGRHVAFASAATNLVSGDHNGATDVFVRDLDPATGAWRTTRVSMGASGQEADGDSTDPSVSADGRYVAFASDATNLVPGDGNGATDVFLWERDGGRVQRISTDALGGDGNGYSLSPSISADGNVVSFISAASNLVAGDRNGYPDVFVWDRTGGQARTSLVSGGAGGQADADAWQQALSADGGAVVFVSDADNLVAGDGNGASDVFVYDRASGQTTLESRGSDGALADDWSYYPAISADGRVVAFDSLATNLAANDGERPDVFVRDRASGQTRIASVSLTGGKADYPSFAPVLSADGRYVAFDSSASNLVAFDANGNGSDVFVRDLAAGTTALVSVDVGASAQPDQSFDAAISPDGSFVAFAGLSVLSSGAADCQYYLRGPLRPPDQPDVPLAAPSTTVPPVETTSLTTEAPSTSTSLSTEPPPAAPTSTLVPTTAPTVG